MTVLSKFIVASAAMILHNAMTSIAMLMAIPLFKGVSLCSSECKQAQKHLQLADLHIATHKGARVASLVSEKFLLPIKQYLTV